MTALVLIDVQQGFDNLAHWGGERNNPDAEDNCKALLHAFREKCMPVYHVQHCSLDTNSPLHESNPGNRIHAKVTPTSAEPIYKKNVNSAFIGTSLETDLKNAGITNLIMAGLTTDHCVSTSVRMAANLEFIVTLAQDATATFNKVGANGENYSAQLIHDTAIASLNAEFADIQETNVIIKNL